MVGVPAGERALSLRPSACYSAPPPASTPAGSNAKADLCRVRDRLPHIVEAAGLVVPALEEIGWLAAGGEPLPAEEHGWRKPSASHFRNATVRTHHTEPGDLTMHISELTSAALEALAYRESTGKAITSVTVEAATNDSGWTSYASTAVVTHHDGETQTLNIHDTALSAALEQHASDEAELGSVVIPIPLPKVAPSNRVRCEEHPGEHIETVACRWPHNVHAEGYEPQVGHPYRVTD